jgi:hypothetical protein
MSFEGTHELASVTDSEAPQNLQMGRLPMLIPQKSRLNFTKQARLRRTVIVHSQLPSTVDVETLD